MRIIVIGAAILDVLAVPVEREVFQSGSYPADNIQMSPGGDALNEAVVLAGLGAEVSLETVVGDDMAGELLRGYCEKRGVIIGREQVKSGLSTGINVVLVQKNGERSFLTNSRGSLRSLQISDIHMPFPKEAKLLCFASIFVFPKIKAEQLVSLFSKAKEQGMIVCADMTKRKNGETLADIAPALAYVDYLFPNAEEAALVTGETEIRQSAQAFLEAGVKHVVIKCGSDGCYIKSNSEEALIPAEKGVNCVDTTGAGDSFVAGFLLALSRGKELRECAKYANWCGARAVEKVGATTWIDSI